MVPRDELLRALPLTELRFQLRGRSGRVMVRYGLNENPEHWGYPLLGLDSSLADMSRGFPVVQAEVNHDAQGYGAVLAWIQVVDMTDLVTGESSIIVDIAPQLEGLELPYFSFGVMPTLFDAPSTTAREMDWTADAFLVACPDALMTRRVRPVCGFTWGYSVRGGKPRALDLRELDGVAWRDRRAFLAEQHPSWTFEDQGRFDRHHS